MSQSESRPFVISDPAEFQQRMRGLAQRGARIGFVPTMGYLHAGHQALMQAARAECDIVAVSIFVNPKQFGPNEDLARYPRDLPGDLGKCRERGVDVVFTPTPEAMYPAQFETKVAVARTSLGLCAGTRPTHFEGVTTVVLKLFMLAQAQRAYFGEKDFQQLAVIRAMVRDLALPISIVGIPTLREPDGLALSSRNVYLSAPERQAALVLKRSLDAMQAAAAAGERDTAQVIAAGARVIAAEPLARLDYLEAVDATTLVSSPQLGGPSQGIGAVFIGKTRLIDNLRIL